MHYEQVNELKKIKHDPQQRSDNQADADQKKEVGNLGLGKNPVEHVSQKYEDTEKQYGERNIHYPNICVYLF
jgi:hypothetical protein